LTTSVDLFNRIRTEQGIFWNLYFVHRLHKHIAYSYVQDPHN